MKRSYDVIILGAGIAGLGTALGLAKRKASVCVVHKQRLEGEASSRAAGILDPFVGVEDPSSPVLELNFRAFQNFPGVLREIKEGTGHSTSYRRTGLVYVALNSLDEKKLREQFQWQKKWMPEIVWVRGETLRKWEPWVTPSVRCGIYYPKIGRVIAESFIQDLRLLAQKRGVRFLAVHEDPKILIHDGEARGIGVGKGEWPAGIVVDAKGSWAGRDPRLFRRPVLKPIRGQILIARGDRPYASRILHSLHGTYVVPWGGCEYLIGSTLEDAGYRPYVTEQGKRKISREVQKFFTALSHLKYVKSWAGLRPKTRDGWPLLGPTSRGGLWMAAGFYRGGILVGCDAGDLLAEWIVGGKRSPLLKSFSPLRFETG